MPSPAHPTVAPRQLEPELAEAYRQCADKSVLAALNPKIFFGYFSVCADPSQGHGFNTTFPGLDWGQSAEALLWLGRQAEVLASWDYVKTFLREDGLIPFAICPDQAGTTVQMSLPKKTETFPFTVAANGSPAPSYQWQCISSNLLDENKRKMERSRASH